MLLIPAASSSACKGTHRLELEIAPEDVDDGPSLVLVDDELAVFDVVAERRHAAHPHALLLGGGDLVADPLADHLPLELGKGQQDIQGQPSHAGGGVELLGDRDEGDAAASKTSTSLAKSESARVSRSTL